MNKGTARRFWGAAAVLAAVLVMAGCGGKDAPKTPAVDVSAETAPDTATILVDSRDGKRYKIVTIDTQTWFARNLDYEAAGSVCYDNKPENCETYGRLYDWNTAMKACPTGWHLPSEAEWDVLMVAVGGVKDEYYYWQGAAGTRLKSTSGWNDYGEKSGSGTDEYGFSALPGGYGNSGGNFDIAGSGGSWWSATEYDASHAYHRDMLHNAEYVYRYYYVKTGLFSVRCAQD